MIFYGHFYWGPEIAPTTPACTPWVKPRPACPACAQTRSYCVRIWEQAGVSSASQCNMDAELRSPPPTPCCATRQCPIPPTWQSQARFHCMQSCWAPHRYVIEQPHSWRVQVKYSSHKCIITSVTVTSVVFLGGAGDNDRCAWVPSTGFNLSERTYKNNNNYVS